MTIDKVFCPTEEKNDRANAEIYALTGGRNKAWEMRCEDCDPGRGGYYWFSLDQCDTPAKALDCIMQLNEKRSSPIAMQSFIDLMEYLFGRGAITDE